jgi:hypothetical protein
VSKLMGIAVLLATAACGASQADGEGALVGTWVGTSPAQPGEVTMVLMDDGSFTWSVFDLEGRWDVEADQLTLFFGSDSAFCADGNLVWDYQIEGTTLTSDVVAGDCGTDPVEVLPESPDWTFELQADS